MIHYSQTEIKDLLKAWLAISIAFAIAMFGFKANLLSGIVIAAFTAGIGFLLHELAHKLVAQKYGCYAEFRAFPSMLWLMLAVSFFGFIFAAPGAVFIRNSPGQKISSRKDALISAAGIITNLVLAAMFIALNYIFAASAMASEFLLFGAQINSWLALFNLLPFWELDGAKVLKGNKVLYFVLVVLAVLALVTV